MSRARRLVETIVSGGQSDGARPEVAARWLRRPAIRVVNVAGPRESEAPGIDEAAAAFPHRLSTCR